MAHVDHVSAARQATGRDSGEIQPVNDTAALTIDGVAKVYGATASTQAVRALEPVDLEVRAGEFISCVGPSGCGKSTLLNIVAGLLPATRGQVLLEGTKLTAPSRDIGVMFQSPVLLPWRTVEKNVLLPGEVFGRDDGALKDKARDVLAKVGLGDFMGSLPTQLSGGMQQRVALARVLTYDPKVLLMDEPFGALDEFTREAMNLELKRMAIASNVTVLFVTHNIAEAVFLADRVVVMSPRPGRVTGIVDVNLGREREIELMHDQAFVDLTFEVRNKLKGEEA
jgi:NitT/TauT family transport system ATP-binding protein